MWMITRAVVDEDDASRLAEISGYWFLAQAGPYPGFDDRT